MTLLEIRKIHYTPSSCLDQKTHCAGRYRREERLSQVHRNLGTKKRKQAHLSVLNGIVVDVPQEPWPPRNAKSHGMGPYDENDPTSLLAKENFLNKGYLQNSAGEYKYNEDDDGDDNVGEQFKIRMLRSHRLKQLRLRRAAKLMFLKDRESKRQRALEQKRWDSLQDAKERTTIAQKLEHAKEAFEILCQQTLKKFSQTNEQGLEEQRNDRAWEVNEIEERSRSSIDGSFGFDISGIDDLSANEGSIPSYPNQDLSDTVNEIAKAAIDILCQQRTLEKVAQMNDQDLEEQRKDRLREGKEIEERIRSSVDDGFDFSYVGTDDAPSANDFSITSSPFGGFGFSIAGTDDLSANEVSVSSSPIQDLIDAVQEIDIVIDACNKLFFCGGIMDPKVGQTGND